MQKLSSPYKRFSRAQREEILTHYRTSQLSQRDFAAQAGISLGTLTVWLRKARGTPTVRGTGTRTAAEPGFIEIGHTLPAAHSNGGYKLHFPSGLSLEIAPGFADAELAQLCQTLISL